MGTFGKIVHMDLTVPNAEEVRDFYQAVAGWGSQGLSMGDYDDYIMTDTGGNPVSGICHKRGENSSQPSQWMLYITVADLDASIAACNARGGTVVTEIRDLGENRFCVIRDPGGAVVGLFEVPDEGDAQ